MADAPRHQSGQLQAVDHEDIELPILEHTTALSDGCDSVVNGLYDDSRCSEPCAARAVCGGSMWPWARFNIGPALSRVAIWLCHPS